MKQPVFRGCGTALVTPMYPDGRVNYSMLRQLIEYQIENGADALVLCGTTGEAPSLDDKEHLLVFAFAHEAIAGRVPFIAGTGSNDTRHAIAMSLEAKQCGADALLLVTPYYNKTNQSGLVRHYNAIADAAGLPVIVYNVPSRTGMNILPETYRELSKHPLIVGAKEAGGSLAAAEKTKLLCGDTLFLYAGNDDQIVPMLSVGAVGAISVLANLAPQAVHEICSLYAHGKHAKSLYLQLQYLPVIEALFSDVSPIAVKAALEQMGMPVGPCRMPLGELDGAKREKLYETLQKAGLLRQAS